MSCPKYLVSDRIVSSSFAVGAANPSGPADGLVVEMNRSAGVETVLADLKSQIKENKVPDKQKEMLTPLLCSSHQSSISLSTSTKEQKT